MRAWAAEVDGKTAGIAGVYYYPEQVVAFSAMRPEYRHMKFLMAKGSLKILQLLKEMNTAVYAVADPEIPGSDEFLLRCGFEYLAQTSKGGAYVWQPTQSR